MKENAKFIKSLRLVSALSLLMIMVFSLSSCKGTGSTTISPTTKEAEKTIEKFIKADKTSIELFQYESEYITYSSSGLSGTVEYSSSDDSVARVDEYGKVYGESIGTARITISISDMSAVVNVTVNESPYTPRIEVSKDSVRLEKDGTYTFTFFTKWNQEKLYEGIEYKVSIDDGYEEYISLSEIDEDKITVTALKVLNGDVASFHINATTRGLTTTRKVEVAINKKALVLEPLSENITLSGNGYELSLETDEINGGLTKAPLTFKDIANNNDIDVEWNLESEGYDSSIAAISKESGTWYISALRDSMTTISGTYTEDGTEPVSISIKVTITKPLVRLESEGKALEVERLSEVSIGHSLKGEITSIELDGKRIDSEINGNSISFIKENMPTSALKLGERYITIITDKIVYEYPITIYTLCIRNKEDFDSMSEIARTNGDFKNTGTMDGYFILESDIEYDGTFKSMTDSDEIFVITRSIGGVWYDGTSFGFKGIFDGMGHNVKGLRVTFRSGSNASGGIFGCINSDGIVRNVSFTDAVVEENHGYICSWGDGLVENVYIKYRSVGVGNDTKDFNDGSTSNNPRYMGSFFTFSVGSNAMVRNCVIDASSADIYYAYDVLRSQPNMILSTKTTNTENLVVICPNAGAKSYAVGNYKYSEYQDLINDQKLQEELKTLPSVWHIMNGIPLFESVYASLDKSDLKFVDLSTTLFTDGQTQIKTNSEYGTITILGDIPEGITLEYGNLKVGNISNAIQLKIEAKSYVDNSTIEATINIYPAETLSITSGQLLETGTSIELDLSLIKDYIGGNVQVNYGTKILGEGTLQDDKLVIDTTSIEEMNDIDIMVQANKNGTYYTIYLNVRHITKKISTLEDLKSLKIVNMRVDNGIYVLVNDIDCKGAKFNDAVVYGDVKIYDTNSGFKGTFDGQGYTISNFTVGSGGLFGHMGKGAVVKNVTYSDVTYNGDYKTSLFGTVLDAVFENITINVKSYYARGDKAQGILSDRYMLRCSLKNITVNAQEAEVNSLTGVRCDGNTYENVVFNVKSLKVIGYSDDSGNNQITEAPEGMTINTTN